MPFSIGGQSWVQSRHQMWGLIILLVLYIFSFLIKIDSWTTKSHIWNWWRWLNITHFHWLWAEMSALSRWDLTWTFIRDGEIVLLCEVFSFLWLERKTDPQYLWSFFHRKQLLPRVPWERFLESHHGTLLAYWLWKAMASGTSDPEYKKWLWILYVLLLLLPAVWRQRQPHRTGIFKVCNSISSTWEHT